MKIKNIFFAAILVIIGFSCSAGDDTIMNDVERGVEEATEANTVLNFGVALNEMATKSTETEVKPGPEQGEKPAGTTNSGEKMISDVSVFLLEGENIIGILRSEKLNDVVSNEDGSIITLKDLLFVTKYKKGRTLDAHVVINGNDFLGNINIGDSKASLDQKISGCLSAEKLIKYGFTRIVFGNNVTEHFPSPSIAKDYPTTILVRVSHVAARLDLSEFSVTLDGFPTGKEPIVKFEEAIYRKINNKGTIFGTPSNDNANAEVSLEISNLTPEQSSDKGQVTFYLENIATTYSYANTATELYVKFSVDGRVFEKTYPINPAAGAGIKKENVDHNGIKAGHLYDIKVRWTITPKWGDSTIEFYTKDWVYNNLGEIVL